MRPDSTNAKILMGYGMTHRSRIREAEALLTEVAAVQPPVSNLWLWVNWGELLARLSRHDEAIKKYQQAVAGKPTRDPNDRAHEMAYTVLTNSQEARLTLDQADAVHRRRIADYPDGLATTWTMQDSWQVPVAVLPVISRNLDEIALLLRAGVDYARLKVNGEPVVEGVRRSGDAELLRALEGAAPGGKAGRT